MGQDQLADQRTFDLPTPFLLPDLSTVPGVATVDGPEEGSLEATYYDTADVRLLRHPVTLRWQTGGPDVGWLVELPGGDGSRGELHFPLDQADPVPPGAVLALVRGIARTAPVGPVATLRIHRQATVLRDAAGAVLAEIADDSVTGTALSADAGGAAVVISWRELEIRVVHGDDAFLLPLAARLAAAGARPSTSPSAPARVLADRLAAVGSGHVSARQKEKRGKKGARSKREKSPTAGAIVLAAVAARVHALQDADLKVRVGDPEGVHELRVAGRRLRSIFAAFRPVLSRETTEPLREQLQWLGTQLSDARDGQVALAHLRGVVHAQPPELVLGPVAARLQQAEVADSETGRGRADRALADDAYFRLLEDLFALLDDPPLTGMAGAPAAEVLVDAMRSSVKRLRRAVGRAGAEGSGDHLHEVRKAAKRLRYTAEVAGTVLGKAARRLVTAMTEVQELLGRRQDTIVTRRQCRTLGLEAFAAGENAWTYGRLHGLEEARGTQAEAGFWALQPRLEKVVAKAISSR